MCQKDRQITGDINRWIKIMWLILTNHTRGFCKVNEGCILICLKFFRWPWDYTRKSRVQEIFNWLHMQEASDDCKIIVIRDESAQVYSWMWNLGTSFTNYWPFIAGIFLQLTKTNDRLIIDSTVVQLLRFTNWRLNKLCFCGGLKYLFKINSYFY